MKHYTVTAAIITNKNEVLCMQRGPGKFEYTSYKYEFPGGKVEAGESYEEALSRELLEEMDLQIDVRKDNFFMTVNHEYPDFSIDMHSYMLPVEDREFVMREHQNHIWLSLDELDSLDWAEADIPIMKKLKTIKI